MKYNQNFKTDNMVFGRSLFYLYDQYLNAYFGYHLRFLNYSLEASYFITLGRYVIIGTTVKIFPFALY